MAEKIFDIRKYLDDKRTYKSLKGHELDFSFRPTALDEIYAAYTVKEVDVLNQSIKYNDFYQDYIKRAKDNNITEEETKGLEEKANTLRSLTSDARKLGIDMIILAATTNGNDQVSKEWLDIELDPREFGYIIRFIMGVENIIETKKKSRTK